MSIDIRITQKGLLKKTLPLHVITGSDLCYGTSDGMKLKENDLSSDEIILYHSNHISRGFSIEWTPEKKDYVDLRALSPDSREGLNDFFAAIQRIASYWKCEIEMDGNTFLEGGMKLSVTVGGEAPEAVGAEAQPADGQTVQAAFDSAVRALSTRLYVQLGEKTKQAIADGL